MNFVVVYVNAPKTIEKELNVWTDYYKFTKLQNDMKR